MLSRFTAATVILAMMSPAYAQDISTPAFDWTGFYAGASIGRGAGNLDVDSFGLVTTAPIDGFAGTVQAGYNHDFGAFVLGAEADFTFINLGAIDPIGPSSFDITNHASLRARAGVKVDRLLPYVTAGIATGTGYFDLRFGPTYQLRQTHLGWTVGLGAEYALTDQLSLRAEYLHTDLGTAHYTEPTAGVLPFDATIRFGTVRVGLNFKF